MANRRFWLGMLVMALIFGMMVFGCDIDGNGNENGNGNGNVALNGTWAGTEIIEWSTSPHWRYCYNFVFGEGCDFPFCNDCIWIDKTESGKSEVKLELMLNDDGNFKMFRGGFPYMKGAYSAGSDKITMNPSHYSGLDFHFGFMIWMDSLNPPWYSKNEFKTEWITSNDTSSSNEQLDIISDLVNDLFASSTSNYSVKGDTFTIVNWAFNSNEAEKQTFTRKNE